MSGRGIFTQPLPAASAAAVWVFYAPASQVVADAFALEFGTTSIPIVASPTPTARAVSAGLVVSSIVRINPVATWTDLYPQIVVGGVASLIGNAESAHVYDPGTDCVPSLAGAVSAGSVTCAIDAATVPSNDGVVIVIATFQVPAPVGALAVAL